MAASGGTLDLFPSPKLRLWPFGRGLPDVAHFPSKLMHQLKEINASANGGHVFKNINNLLCSSYREQIKKFKGSMKTGSGAVDIYRPKL